MTNGTNRLYIFLLPREFHKEHNTLTENLRKSIFHPVCCSGSCLPPPPPLTGRQNPRSLFRKASDQSGTEFTAGRHSTPTRTNKLIAGNRAPSIHAHRSILSPPTRLSNPSPSPTLILTNPDPKLHPDLPPPPLSMRARFFLPPYP